MDALKILTTQHREVEALFTEFEGSDDDNARRACFEEIADSLAIHATIEERHFYPVVRTRQTEENVEESYDEHLEIKRLLVDAMDSMDEPGFDAKVAALKGAVEHHVDEEENELFPKVEKLLDEDQLEAIGEELEAETLSMKSEGGARANVQVEIEPPAIQPS